MEDSKEKRKTRKLIVNISEDCYKRLEDQLSFVKNSNLHEFKEMANTVEQLVEKYLEQLTTTNHQIEEMQDKIQEMMKVFNNKGLDINEILNSFSEKIFEGEKKANPKKNYDKKN